MCYLGCSVIASRGSDGRLSLRGNPASPVNRGKLCAKGKSGSVKLEHPERVGSPLVRSGPRGAGRWRRASWDEVLGTIAAHVRETIVRDGPQSFVFWQNLDMERAGIFERFTYALGSPNFVTQQSICDSSAHIGAALAVGSVRVLSDFENAECIVTVGHNPLGARDLVYASQRVLDARDRGAKLIVVDPRLSETAMHASRGLWIPIRPGTDGILLAGIAHRLIETGGYDAEFVRRYTFGFSGLRDHLRAFDAERVCAVTGVPRDRLDAIVEAMKGRRTLVDINRGAVAHRDGAQTAFMSIILNTLLGSVDRAGGRTLVPWPPIALSQADVVAPPIERIDGSMQGRLPLPIGRRRDNPLSLLGICQNVPRAILDEDPYPVRTLFFLATNPVFSLSNGGELTRALDKVGLVVAMDAFMSETAKFADIVLPAAVYLETTDLWFPTHPGLSLRQAVAPPYLESRSAQEVTLELAHRLDLAAFAEVDTYESYLRAELEGTGIAWATLVRDGFVEADRSGPTCLERGLDTPSGKIELTSTLLGMSGFSPYPQPDRWAEGEETAPSERFHLISFKLPFHTNSATGALPHLSDIQPTNAVWVNRSAAARLGIRTGERVALSSERGDLEMIARVTDGVRPDTLAVSHHFGHTALSMFAAGRGANINAIAAQGSDPVGGNSVTNDSFVTLRKVAS
jgi:thiosulfate reductase/polysulfide reductase chain A